MSCCSDVRSYRARLLREEGGKETMQHDSSLNSSVETALSPDAENGTRQFSRRTIAYTLVGTMLVTFIATLDQTIVGTALPRIGADLQGFDRLGQRHLPVDHDRHYSHLWQALRSVWAQADLSRLSCRLPDRFCAERPCPEHDTAHHFPCASGHRRRWARIDCHRRCR